MCSYEKSANIYQNFNHLYHEVDISISIKIEVFVLQKMKMRFAKHDLEEAAIRTTKQEFHVIAKKI